MLSGLVPRRVTAIKTALALLLVAAALYAGNMYFERSLRRGLGETAATLADTLGSIGFRRIERLPKVAIVTYGQDTVATLGAAGELNVGVDTPTTLLLLGRWADTDGGRVARSKVGLSASLDLSPDSTRLVVHLLQSAGPDTNRVRGYLLLVPDSRWITVY